MQPVVLTKKLQPRDLEHLLRAELRSWTESTTVDGLACLVEPGVEPARVRKLHPRYVTALFRGFRFFTELGFSRI